MNVSQGYHAIVIHQLLLPSYYAGVSGVGKGGVIESVFHQRMGLGGPDYGLSQHASNCPCWHWQLGQIGCQGCGVGSVEDQDTGRKTNDNLIHMTNYITKSSKNYFCYIIFEIYFLQASLKKKTGCKRKYYMQ